MANNQATIDKLAATNPGAMEFDAAVDAIKFLQMSPELPPPTGHIADFGGTLGIALQWTDAERTMWARASFSGDGSFNWMYSGREPPGSDDPAFYDDEGDDAPVERGAPKAMSDFINHHLKSGQQPSSS